MFRLLSLTNGWTDFDEIWYALGDPLVTAYAVLTGGVSLHSESAHAHVHSALLYLRNGLADCVSNLVCGLGVITEVLSTSHGWGASARTHVRTPFPYLKN